MEDPTEELRKLACDEINAQQAERQSLESQHGQVWDTQELQRDFEVKGFMAPFVIVVRKSDNTKGSMLFQHSPRYYWGFKED